MPASRNWRRQLSKREPVPPVTTPPAEKATVADLAVLEAAVTSVDNAKVPKGPITGSSLTIATDRLAGRDSASSGAIEEIAVGGGIEFTGSQAIQTSAFTGDVTKSAGGTATTIPNNTITNAKAADMAQSTIKGRAEGAGTGDPTDLTPLQAMTVLVGAASKGDIIYYDGTTWQRLAIGSAGQVLTVSGSNLPEWV